MAGASVKERREDPRCPVSGRIPAQMVDANGALLMFFPVDVSRGGMGVIFDLSVKRGDVLNLKGLKGAAREVKLEVVWVEKPYNVLDVYRVGLKVLDQDVDLKGTIALFDSVMIEETF